MDDSNEGRHVGRIDALTPEPPRRYKLFSLNEEVKYRSGSKSGACGAPCVYGEPERGALVIGDKRRPAAGSSGGAAGRIISSAIKY